MKSASEDELKKESDAEESGAQTTCHMTMNQVVPMPIKKRRGRPPKYLDVWQQEQYLRNSAGTGCGQSTNQELERCSPESSYLGNTSPISSASDSNQSSPRSDSPQEVHSPATTCVTMSTPTPPTQAETFSARALDINNNNNDNNNNHQPAAMAPSIPLISSTSPSITTTLTMNPLTSVTMVTAPGPAPGQPTKRRPGRPPGSTKRFKAQTTTPMTSTDPAMPEDFTLRKFFEAGGRDYNDYLDWLKKRQAQAQARLSPPMPVGFSPMLAGSVAPLPYPCAPGPLPMSPVPAFTQAASRMTSQAITLNSSVCRLPEPFQIPFPVPLAQLRPDLFPVPVAPTMSPPLSQLSPKSASPPRDSPTQPSPRSPTPGQDSGVLDLSSKRPRLENDLSRSPFHYTSCEASTRLSQHSGRDSPHSDQQDDRMSTGSDVTTTCNVTCELTHWGVEEVANFVSSVPGCQEYVEAFREHRIDGTSLSHLSEEHLLNFVKMKLGPAIRLRLAVQRMQGLAQP